MMVLEAFDAGHKSLSISEIAERTKLGRSAAQRFIYTLHQLGYLRRDPLNKHYKVSLKVIDLAKSLIGVDTQSERVVPILEQIARRTQETVAWVERDDLEIVILKSIPSTHLSSVNLPVGQRFAALSSSSGQVLLAHSSKEEILKTYRNSNEYARKRFGEMSDEEVLEYFGTVRKRGFSITEKMEDHDSISISSPVINPRGEAVGAINISVLKTRYTKQDVENVLSSYLLEIGRQACIDLFE